MPIRNILLHMGADPHHLARLRVGIDLARRYGAHLEIAFIASPAGMPHEVVGRGASAGYIAEATAIAREKAARLLEELREDCERAGIDWNWEVLEGNHNEVLVERSLFADLIVVTQKHGIEERHVGFHIPDEVIRRVPCPVLVLPRTVDTIVLGKRVMVAWRESREAAHAVRIGRDFIRNADKVLLLIAREPGEAEATRDIAVYLRRHGVDPEVANDIDVGDRHVGSLILEHARGFNADMVIMGAYGRSILRETFFGSVTDHVLEQADLPLLLVH